MAEIDFGEGETFSQYLARIEEAERQYAARFTEPPGIILSTDFETEILREGAVTRMPILWRLYQYPIVYVVTVAAGTRVPEHSHDESMFRLLTRGSLVVRVAGREYEIRDGMWFVIREGTPYAIETEEGYRCVSNYGQQCRPGRRA